MSVFSLKIIAIILMIVDHIGHFFPNIKYAVLFRMFGRIVAPIFFYLLVEGFIHTSDRKKYSNRLLVFGLIMSIGNMLLLLMLYLLKATTVYNIGILKPNIFITMFLCLEILKQLENIKDNLMSLRFITSNHNANLKSIFLLLIYITLIISCEYSVYALMMVIVFYLFRDMPILKFFTYIFLSIILCYLTYNIIQIFMIFAVFPLMFYNGKKGYSTKCKYFFYLFYMIHIWLFAILSLLIN